MPSIVLSTALWSSRASWVMQSFLLMSGCRIFYFFFALNFPFYRNSKQYFCFATFYFALSDPHLSKYSTVLSDRSVNFHCFPMTPRSRSQITRDECRSNSNVSVQRYFGMIAKPLQRYTLGQDAFDGIQMVQAVPPVTLPPVVSHSETILCCHEPFCSCPLLWEALYRKVLLKTKMSDNFFYPHHW